MRASLHNTLGTGLATILAIVLTGTLHAQTQETPDKKTPILLYGFLDASIISADIEGGIKNGPRSGIIVTHNPTGWGIGFARQAMRFRGTGPTIRGDGWFGPWSREPKDEVTFRSLMATKEFHTSSPVFRPGIEAGVSFVSYKREVLEADTFLILTNRYVPHTEKTVGLDLRAKILLALAPGFGVEAAVQANFNDLQPYSSFAIGIAAGLVRSKRR